MWADPLNRDLQDVGVSDRKRRSYGPYELRSLWRLWG